MQITNAADVVAATADRHAELARILRGLRNEDLAAPSLLPGWNRLTIACHLRFGAEANHTMTRATLNGEMAAYYPGGRAQQRPSTLTPSSNEQPLEVVDSLIRRSSALDSLWQSLDPSQWALDVREPEDNADLGSVTLGMLALLRLTEVEVRGHDLDIGCAPWSETFVETALPVRVKWLATRRSNHSAFDPTVQGTWILQPNDGTAFSISTTESGVEISEGTELNGDAEIHGSRHDLLAFLLGRIQISALSITGDRQLAESFNRAFPAP